MAEKYYWITKTDVLIIPDAKNVLFLYIKFIAINLHDILAC